MRAAVTLLLAALAAPAQTGEPALVAHGGKTGGAVSLDAGRFLFLTVPGYDGSLTYDVDGDAVSIFPVAGGVAFPGWKQGESKAAIHKAPESKSDVLAVFGETKGMVTVAAWGIRDGRPVKLSTLVLSVQGARPPPPVPDPKPDPKPDPDPLPTGKLNHWVLIEESSKPIPNRAAIITAAIQWTKTNSLKHVVADQDQIDPLTGQVPAVLKDYIAAAKTAGVPQLFLCDAEGRTLWQGTPPATADEWLKLLGRFK